MSDEQNTEQVDPGKEAMVAEIDRLRAVLEEVKAALSDHEVVTSGSPHLITPEEQRRRHGDELLSVLLGPNTGAGTIR